MNLTICSPHCGVAPETTSGGETYERELLVRLGQDGVRVELILARGKPHPQNVPNWRVHRFSIGRGLRWWLAPFVVPEAIGSVWREHQFDLLRVHSLRYIGPSALWARRLYAIDAPVISHHHHLDPSWLNPIIEKRVILGSDRVITVSEFSRTQLSTTLGIPSEHISAIPNGVASTFVHRPKRDDLVNRYELRDGPVVLFFGGLKPRKNLGLLLEVWSMVASAVPRARLIIAGGGQLLGQLRSHADRLGVTPSVRFTGYVPEAEKIDHFNLADVFFFPSALEGFGLSVAEAMSVGLPVVTSNRGSLPELVVEGKGGFVREPDRDAFVRALVELLGSSDLRRQMGAFNRERVDRLYRWERCVDGTRRVYEATVEAWRRRRVEAPR